jgi:hypothetical protein
MKRTTILVCIFVAVLGAVVLHSWYYMPFLSDDALISLRYADRFLEGKGLTWTDGRPVEGYSNLSWILLASLLGAFGADLIHAVRILGVLGMGSVALAVLWWYAGRGRSPGIALPLGVGLGFFVLAGPIAVWTIGGMEQPLLAALIGISIPLTWIVIDSDRTSRAPVALLSVVLGLLCITRPDGAIYAAAAVVSVFAGERLSNRRTSNKTCLWLLAFPFLFLVGQLAFRLAYYGEALPNTALVKIAPSLQHLSSGLRYVAGGLWALFPLSALAVASLAATVVSREKRPRGIYLLTMAVMWIGYLVFIGGDIFPAYRHFVPLIVVFMFALVEGAGSVSKAMRKLRTKKAAALTAAALVVLFVPYVYTQFTHKENKKALAEQWVWDGEVLGGLLKTAFWRERPLVAVTAAGCVPYWSELPSLDMLGLNDYYLPRHRPADFGKGPLGHELGDGAYVMSRAPDIVCFHVGSSKAVFRSGIELQQIPHFYEEYVPVLVEGNDPRQHRAVLWFRKRSEKIGITVTDSTITVPAYLLNLGRGAWASLNSRGALVISVQAGQLAEGLVEFAGDTDWNVKIEGSNPSVVQHRLQPGKDGVLLTLFTTASEAAEIERVVLTRRGGTRGENVRAGAEPGTP